MLLCEVRARFEARVAPSMSTSPSESKASFSSSDSGRVYTGAAAAGGRIVIGMFQAGRSGVRVGAGGEKVADSSSGVAGILEFGRSLAEQACSCGLGQTGMATRQVAS